MSRAGTSVRELIQYLQEHVDPDVDVQIGGTLLDPSFCRINHAGNLVLRGDPSSPLKPGSQDPEDVCSCCEQFDD